MAKGTVKLTISMPPNLMAVADEVAREKRISRSKVVHLCLQELAEKRLRRRMEEGYKAMAKENLAFAAEAFKLADEVVFGKDE